MSDYSIHPPTDQQRVLMPIIRVRPNAPLKVVVRSECWYGRMTHFADRRTVLCGVEGECDLCKTHIQCWKGFMVVRSFSSERLALLSITPPVIGTLSEAMIGRPSATGLVVVFSRIGNELNSPLHSQTFGFLDREPKVSVEETREHVERIFKPSRSLTLYTGWLRQY